MTEVRSRGRRLSPTKGTNTKPVTTGRVVASRRVLARVATYEPTAEECIFKMPTLAEVVGRGYAASKYDEVKLQHGKLLEQFETDPVFRAEAIADWRERRGVTP